MILVVRSQVFSLFCQLQCILEWSNINDETYKWFFGSHCIARPRSVKAYFFFVEATYSSAREEVISYSTVFVMNICSSKRLKLEPLYIF